MPKDKKDTLCWTCQWAAGKEEKCPWANKFQPVPGWKAVPTKITIAERKCGYIESFAVSECPLYELMGEFKHRIVENAGQVKHKKPKRASIYDDALLEAVKTLWFDKGFTAKEISAETCIGESAVYRAVKKIKERMKW